MRAPARIGLYAAGLGVVFVASAAIAGAVAPDDAAPDPAASHPAEQHAAPVGVPEQESTEGTDMTRGLSLEQDGYTLGEVEAPGTVGEAGELAFTVTDPAGEPVTEFDVSHEERLHLIVVRSDGAHFRHVHPVMDADGRWSLPWAWDAAGTYRVYADAAPSAGGAVTLTRTVDVAGELAPARDTEVSTTATVDGYDVALDGQLQAGTTSRLTVKVTRDGAPVTTLEPYLGAYGHLVALRDGDLAYLHVHPEGAEPEAGQVSGPTVTFGVEAPTPGRYLLYLDFQVEGQVRTAAFVVEATPDGTPAPAPAPAPEDSPGAGHDPATHDH
ncbi:hypothetical protein [Cellulosimicrobium cellulans]|uniref:Heavy metal-binding domain-containing protein n=1 Tax=Cellulosimicrobium cellulans TaxID=1710 RepID=A0A4Y4E0S0_CELCE|nr:hypothetical protein [Cellulosimicrobium cellulans]GED11289.1 hypothetical protein CCE02nite_32880 [Cellulosimicrobium cellulans]